MNKNEFVTAVADIAEMTKTDANKAVDAFCEAVMQALAKGEDVRLVGFGNFEVVHRKASEGRNPRTGEVIQIPASNQPKFKAGKQLKDSCNDKKDKKAA